MDFLAQNETPNLHFLFHEVNVNPWQVASFKRVLERFYGEDPLQSADLSRIVNSKQFKRLTNLIEEKRVADKIVYGGKADEKQL
jgi:aldehyde dehydrogenase (NAD+)